MGPAIATAVNITVERIARSFILPKYFVRAVTKVKDSLKDEFGKRPETEILLIELLYSRGSIYIPRILIL